MTFPLLEAARERIRVARFLTDAEVACAVMVRGEDFVLLQLQGAESFDAERDAALAAGYRYAGCIGLTAENEPLSISELSPVCGPAFFAACIEFVRLEASRFIARQAVTAGDSVAWLDKLAVLPDVRTTGGAHA